MYCRECGNEIGEANFCKYCGAAINKRVISQTQKHNEEELSVKTASTDNTTKVNRKSLLLFGVIVVFVWALVMVSNGSGLTKGDVKKLIYVGMEIDISGTL